ILEVARLDRRSVRVLETGAERQLVGLAVSRDLRHVSRERRDERRTVRAGNVLVPEQAQVHVPHRLPALDRVRQAGVEVIRPRVLRYPLDSYKDVWMPAWLDAHELAPTCTKLLRLSFLEHAVGAVALCRVEDAPVAEPEGDVRRPFVPVGDEVARAQFVLGDRR